MKEEGKEAQGKLVTHVDIQSTCRFSGTVFVVRGYSVIRGKEEVCVLQISMVVVSYDESRQFTPGFRNLRIKK
jgi:hypothetical protein